MGLTEHARMRLRQRRIDERHLELVLEHGEWNARGDRLTLGRQSLERLIEHQSRTLRRIERAHYEKGKIKMKNLELNDV